MADKLNSICHFSTFLIYYRICRTCSLGYMLTRDVKQGDLQNGMMVAVKRLFAWNDFSEKQFLDEFTCLKRVKHQNIVRLLGYCAYAQGEVMEIEGENRFVEEHQKFLCFEYVPNGNLYHYLKGI